MKKTFLNIALVVGLSCLPRYRSHGCEMLGERPSPADLLDHGEQDPYRQVLSALERHDAADLKECNCMAAFRRDFYRSPDGSTRFVFDATVSAHAAALSRSRNEPVNMLFVGSGMLLNELTAVAQIISRRITTRIYLHDWNYAFYGDPNFRQKVRHLTLHPQEIPPAWREFFSGYSAIERREEFLEQLAAHHRALDQFKAVVDDLDSYYGISTEVVVLPPTEQFPQEIPAADIIVAIDAYLDLERFTCLLKHRYALAQRDFKFIALNKSKETGGFWIGQTDKPVRLTIYDFSMDEPGIAATTISMQEFLPSKAQLQRAIDFQNCTDGHESPLQHMGPLSCPPQPASGSEVRACISAV